MAKQFNKDNYRCFNFPIVLLKDLFIDKNKAFNNIFDIAIYKFSMDKNNLDKLQYLALSNNLPFLTELDLFITSAKYHNVTLGNYQKSFDNAVTLINSIDSNNASVGISSKMLFEFYKNDKSENELVKLACFLAIKSILGKKKYCKTNKALVHARMFGYSSTNDVPPIEGMSQLQYKYFAHDKINRYQIDELLKIMQLDWHLKLISDHIKGFYLSFNCTLNQLADASVKAKKATKEKALIEAKKKALADAKARNK